VIPVRVPALAKPVLASDRVFDIAPGHPLSDQDCPVCDGPLVGHPVVLVFVGIAPDDRKPAGFTTGGAVTVHEACTVGPGMDEAVAARATQTAVDGIDAMTAAQESGNAK
jgi:hypothetical protein